MWHLKYKLGYLICLSGSLLLASNAGKDSTIDRAAAQQMLEESQRKAQLIAYAAVVEHSRPGAVESMQSIQHYHNMFLLAASQDAMRFNLAREIFRRVDRAHQTVFWDAQLSELSAITPEKMPIFYNSIDQRVRYLCEDKKYRTIVCNYLCEQEQRLQQKDVPPTVLQKFKEWKTEVLQ